MRVHDRVTRTKDDRADRQWHRRPVLSFALRLAVFAGPILASVAIAALLSSALPKAVSALTAALWIAVVMAGSLVTLVVFERAARRLLPLAALLDVSLLFPDKAPKRFAVVRQTGSQRDLQARLVQARESGHVDEARSMQAVIELVLALSVHDKGTRGHSERVRVFTDLLADELKIDAYGRSRLRWAALLHDVGKLEVPSAILTKDGKPDEAEWAVLHRHPEEGARLVGPLLPWLGEYGSAVVEHHERWDGTGYPLGLNGTQISLAGRIVAVADTYEVMTAPRPYKRPMSVAASRLELTRVAGTQLDPAIVRAFLNISVGRLWRVIGFGAWIGQIPAVSRVLTGFGRASVLALSGVATGVAATLLALGGLGGIRDAHPGVMRTATASSVSLGVPRVPGLTGLGGPTPRSSPGKAASSAPGHMAATPSATADGISPTSSGGSTPSPIATPSATSSPTSPPTAAPAPSPTPTPTPPPTPPPPQHPRATGGTVNGHTNAERRGLKPARRPLVAIARAAAGGGGRASNDN